MKATRLFASLVILGTLGACTRSGVLDEGFRGDDAANGSLYFSLAPSSSMVTNESGGTATFTIVMLRQPAANVVVPLVSANSGEGQVYQQGGNCSASGQPSAASCNITFTPANWNVAQTVKVGGTDDSVQDLAVSYKVVTSPTSSTDPNFARIDPPDITLTNNDNDTPGLSVVPAIFGQNHTTESLGTTVFNVTLNSQPSASVTLTINSTNTSAGLVGRNGSVVCDLGTGYASTACTLTFSGGSCVQSAGSWCYDLQIRIRGVDNAVLNGSAGTAYNLSVTAASADLNYNGMATTASLVNDDNESGKRIFTTASTTVPTFATTAAADNYCATDVNKPSSGTYKAMIAKSTATTRVACSNALCSPAGGQANWVLLANTSYFRASDGVLVGTTNSNAIFTFPLSASFVASASSYFTGMNNDWTTGQDNVGWAGTGFANTGDGAATSNSSIFNGSVGWALARGFLCIEQ